MLLVVFKMSDKEGGVQVVNNGIAQIIIDIFHNEIDNSNLNYYFFNFNPLRINKNCK